MLLVRKIVITPGVGNLAITIKITSYYDPTAILLLRIYPIDINV